MLEVARLNPGILALVMFSGVFALCYNLLLYKIVTGLSPYFASFAANFNKIASIGLALLLGVEVLPQGGWKFLMMVGLLGNMACFTAYSVYPTHRPVGEAHNTIKDKVTLDKAGGLTADRVQ